MKAILYAGAVLMTGASIYGFIDYKKSNHRKEFTNMYKTGENETVTEKTLPAVKATANEMKKEITGIKTIKPALANKKKTRPVIAVAKEIKPGKEIGRMTLNPVEPVKSEEISTDKVNPKPSSIKGKKVVSYKLFSRGSLEKKYIDKELKSKKGKQ